MLSAEVHIKNAPAEYAVKEEEEKKKKKKRRRRRRPTTNFPAMVPCGRTAREIRICSYRI